MTKDKKDPKKSRYLSLYPLKLEEALEIALKTPLPGKRRKSKSKGTRKA